jgi:hypothetical protein
LIWGCIRVCGSAGNQLFSVDHWDTSILWGICLRIPFKLRI